MNISERIAELLKQRAAKVAALEEFQKATETDGRLFNEEEQQSFDTLLKDVEAIDGQLGRLRQAEDVMARAARPVIQVQPTSQRKLDKGIGFARYVQLIVASQGNDLIAEQMAKAHFQDMPELPAMFRARAMGYLRPGGQFNRAATTAATTLDQAWAGVLVYANQLAGELIELVRAQAILGRLPGLRAVPFNVRIPRETAVIGSAGWVGQGASKPVGKGGYDFVTMPFSKAALIVVITEELARFSNPAAEGLMRDGLVRAVSEFLDLQFIGAAAAVANVSPAGILNALPPGQSFPSSGDTAVHMSWDIQHAMSLLNGGLGARAPALLMHTNTAASFGFATNAFGAPVFPNGLGAPIVASSNVPADQIILIDQDLILHAEDGGVEVDISREASLQLDTAPANPPTPLVSLWQQNLIGLRAEKFEHWLRARDTAVVQITGVGYGTTPPVALAQQQLGLPPTQQQTAARK